MTPDVPKSPSPDSPPGVRKKSSWTWRILAIVAILVAMILVADFLRSPGKFGVEDPSARGGPDEKAFAKTPSPEEGAAPQKNPAVEADLRRIMAGILMNAADEPGEYKNPANRDPNDRRQFLADRFGLSPQYPQSDATADLVPRQAKVLAVFDSPNAPGSRMAILRMTLDIGPAMSELHSFYVSQGWKRPDPLVPERQTDEGWLMRFVKPGRERIVYARPRPAAGETLVAVYDSPR
jgi:hypothetical protein